VYFCCFPCVNLSDDKLASSDALDTINKTTSVLQDPTEGTNHYAIWFGFSGEVIQSVSWWGFSQKREIATDRLARLGTSKEVKTDCTECALEAADSSK